MLEKNFNLRYWGCDEKFCLMIQKGVYQYEYINSWEIFEEINLPPKNAFYSKLNMEGICDKDYENVQQFWNTMEKKNPKLPS